MLLRVNYKVLDISWEKWDKIITFKYLENRKEAALGIEVESPQLLDISSGSEDLKRIARPVCEARSNKG